MKRYLMLPTLVAASHAAFCAAPSQLQPVPFTSVKVTDAFWAPRIQRNLSSTLPANFHQCEVTGRIRNFDKASGRLAGEYEGLLFNDSDVYKVLEGAAYSLAHKRDPKVEAKCDEWIDKIAAAQQPDGYLNTYYTVKRGLEHRHTNEASDHETYSAGHLIEGACAYYQATGKRKFLDVAIRLADYYDRVYGPGKKYDAPGHEEIELALVKLYRVTKQPRYLKLAEFFIEQRGRRNGGRPMQGEYSQDHIPVVEQREIQGHAVRAMYLYCGVADIAAITGNPAYIRTMDAIWPDVVLRKMYITGGIGPSGSNEGFTTAYDLPNDSAYAESCAAIALALWNQRMAMLHADAKYADVVERCIYNGILSGIGQEGDTFFYGNPLGSRGGYRRSPWFDCACCPTNLVRYIPTVGGLVYATTPSSVYVNQYIGSTASMEVAKTKLTVTQQTRYPWDGEVVLTVSPAKPARFTLNLRVPSWCQGKTGATDLYRYQGRPSAGAVSLFVNGRRVTEFGISKGYATLNRTWKKGDTVTWVMPMPVRRVKAHPAVKYDAGKVALQRGPVVYCLEDVDNDNRVRRTVIPPEADLTAQWRGDLLGGLTVIRGEGIAQASLSEPAKRAPFTAIPYFAWCNRGADAMVVWVPEDERALPGVKPPTIASKARLSWSSIHASRTAPNDQLEPSSSHDAETPWMDWWPRNGTTEWLQYDFDKTYTVAGAEVYWFQDYPAGGCALPGEWHIEYRDGGEWKPVPNPGAYGVEKDRFNRVSFDPVTTDGLRLVVKSREGLSSGVYEWKVVECVE